MTDDRFIRMPELARLLGVSSRTVYRMIAAGRFVSPVCVSDRAVAWPRQRVQEWMQSKIETAERA